MLSRRRFFRSSAAWSGAVLGFPHLARSAEVLHQTPGQRPRHIIHLVADGMSWGTFTCAHHFSRVLRKRGLTWMELYTRPEVRQGLMNMRSLNSLVTDSSAASSSWGSGSRIINGAVNQLPDGTPLKTLYELFAEQGWKRGLVTTTEITHATPAGFVACVDARDTGSAIAVQYLQRRVEVLLGGGSKFFDPKLRRDKRDLRTDFARAGYVVMDQAADLKAADVEKPWLGTFAVSHLPFSIDRDADPKLQSKVPTLATMTRAALDWLQRHDHFILQVEGGRVDHACHNNDAATALREMLAFDEALDVVLAFQKQVPDTLIIVTTDHGTANLGLNGMGSAYGQSLWLFENLLKVKCSFPEILRQLKKKSPAAIAAEEAKISEDKKEDDTKDAKDFSGASAVDNAATPNPTAPAGRSAPAAKPRDYVPTAKEIVDILRATTGYKVSERRAGLLIPYLSKKGTPAYELMNSDVAQLGQLLGNHLAIGWTGTAHTADFVPIVALGPGSERFAGLIQNVDVFRHYTQLAGIDFKNPEEELIGAVNREAGDVENIAEYAEAWA